MASQGHRRQVDLARAADISESTVSRLIYSDSVPDPETLNKIAPALGVDPQKLILMTHVPDADEAPPAPRQRHPLVVEIERMLAPDSPIPPEDLKMLERMLDRVIDHPYRQMMRRRRSA